MTFTNLTQGGNLPYQDACWDFGDGTIICEQAINYGETIVHCYQNAGVFDVRLTMEDDAGWEAYQIELDYITVSPPPCSITVISPNGGENWELGSTHPITWTSSNAGGIVKIELYKGTTYYKTITSSTPNDGSFSWPIPSSYDAYNSYRIKITDTIDSSCHDYSNSVFALSNAPPPFEGEGTVGVSGGTVTTGDGKVSLEFPAGTFTSDTIVTIKSASCRTAPEGYTVQNTCFSITTSPSLAELAKDAIIKVKYSFTDWNEAEYDRDRLKLAYYSGREWNLLATTVASGTVSAHTDHLSDWAVLTREDGSAWQWWYTLAIALGALIIIGAISSLLVLLMARRRARNARIGEFKDRIQRWREEGWNVQQLEDLFK